MAKSFIPLGDRVVLEQLEDTSNTTPGGVFIPDNAKDKPQEGKVIAVGPGRTTDDGKTVAITVKVGDTVVYSKYAGTEVKQDGSEYVIVRESDILAVVQ